MLIKDEELRIKLKKILFKKTPRQVVLKIREHHKKFQEGQIKNFLAGNDVTLSTLKKLDEYVSK